MRARGMLHRHIKGCSRKLRKNRNLRQDNHLLRTTLTIIRNKPYISGEPEIGARLELLDDCLRLQ